MDEKVTKFVNEFYGVLDSDWSRPVEKYYLENAILIWNGVALTSRDTISTFLKASPPMRHKIQVIQVNANASSIGVSVMGMLSVADSPYKTCTDFLQVIPNDSELGFIISEQSCTFQEL
ncbi:hypothetical protein DL93DRAFT_2089562 [Clavulina sp. PMI_390]|nr:hypothetical protein DL93DRAFT_2089562 [Clavulina sp. PMI_390]